MYGLLYYPCPGHLDTSTAAERPLTRQRADIGWQNCESFGKAEILFSVSGKAAPEIACRESRPL
jgi:hypothetical protein